jgi:hypothetical protein
MPDTSFRKTPGAELAQKTARHGYVQLLIFEKRFRSTRVLLCAFEDLEDPIWSNGGVPLDEQHADAPRRYVQPSTTRNVACKVHQAVSGK